MTATLKQLAALRKARAAKKAKAKSEATTKRKTTKKASHLHGPDTTKSTLLRVLKTIQQQKGAVEDAIAHKGEANLHDLHYNLSNCVSDLQVAYTSL